MERATPEEQHQMRCYDVVLDVLKHDTLTLSLEKFILTEDVKEHVSIIDCELLVRQSSRDKKIKILGTGNGVLDALFSSLVEEFSSDYCCLSSLKFEDFCVSAKFKEGSRNTKTDSPVEIRLTVGTGPYTRTHFRYKSTSIVVASIEVVRSAIEYFINLELAMVQLSKDLRCAKERNRQDLIIDCTSKMMEITKIISCEKVLEK